MIVRDTRLMVSLQILLVILSFQFLAYARAEVTSLSPIDDAYVSSLYRYINRGSDMKLVLAWYQDFSGGYALDVKIPAYLKFDLSNIPSDAEISSAKLELYAINVTIPSDIVAICCPDNSWNEREITYAKAPKYDWRTPPITTHVSEANAWYSWDLTNDIKNARGGQLTEVLQINTFIVGQRPNHISFYSKETSDSSYRPRLKIEYVSHKVSASETATYVTEEKTQITPLPPPGTIGFPIFWIEVPIIALCIFAAGAWLYLRSRRGAPPFARRRVKPISYPSPQVSKTPPAMPEVPPAAKEKKLPEVKRIPVGTIVPLDDRVYQYIVDHGGEISWSQAARDLGVSIEELKASVERLKQAKRIE